MGVRISGLAARLLVAVSILVPHHALAAIEEIVVTAQKRTENLQDVPIAMSAFDSNELDKKQISTFSDLQFNVPSVSYTKGNFSGSNFSIRGIGSVVVATSGDSGVGVHVNDVYIQEPRLFETEYYDIQQLEVLRGPQGTLYGRNATGGAINMKTARPVINELSADIEAQLGNYAHTKIKGAVNIPINDRMAGRIAGIYLERDGYTDNLFTGNDIDDRSQWSVRASLRMEPTDSTVIDIIGHTFEEDSSRSRSQKQFCDFDPSGILGCLPTTRQTDAINPHAALGFLLPSTFVLGPDLGLFNPIANPATPEGNPSDMRDVSAFFDPIYEASEDFVMIEVKQTVTDWLDMTFIAAWQETEVISEQDYNGTVMPETVDLPAAFPFVFPGAARFLGTGGGGAAPVSTVPNVHTSMGIPSGDFVLSETFSAVDTSTSFAEQQSAELRFNSQLSGPFNFMLAGSWFEFEEETDYFVRAPGLDYLSLTALGPTADPNASFNFWAPGFFNNETNDFELDSWGIFGEAYYNLNETMKLTVGLRYNVDDKFVRDRQLLYNVPVEVDVATGDANVFGTPVTNIDQALAAGVAVGAFDADPNVPGAQLYREDSVEFKEWTGRIVLDWMPEVSFTDTTLAYLSYSRGYKSGGINPAIDTTLFPNTAVNFEPEEIDAWEVGTKNQLWNNSLQANLSAFYYDYSGLQVSKIINRTAVNENIDADIYGMEAEFLLEANQNWLLNASLSYLKSEIGELSTVDPRDPTQGRQDVALIKDLEDASNCVVEYNGQGPLLANAAFQGALGANSVPYIPTGAATGIPETPGVNESAISSCVGMQAIAPAFGYNYSDGITTNVEGNDLPNSPELTVNLGAQYTHFFGNGSSLTGRVDYYWQDDYSARIFARQQDMVDAWDVWNAQATYTSPSGDWWVRAFIRNIEDDDEITGLYATDPSSALFTNAFFIEPRLYGLSVGLQL